MKRLLSIASPLGSSVSLRLAQLAVMAAAGHSLEGPDRASTLAAFGVVAAFGVFTDSGASMYILTRESVSQRDLRLAIGVQGMASATGAIAAVSFCAATLPWSSIPAILAAPLSLAAAQAAESIGRVARASRLQTGDDFGFAANDGALAAAKIAVAVALTWVGDMRVLLLLPVSSIAITIVLATLNRRRLTPAEWGDSSVFQILRFGLAGVSSGLYSQVPFLVVAGIAPVHVVAALSVLLRAVQPLEIAPSIASQQVIPRIGSRGLDPAPVWAAFVAVGAATGAAVWLFAPLIGAAFNQPVAPTLMILLVALSVPPKFGNYALAAFLLRRGRVFAKTVASLAVGLVATVACLIAVPSLGAVGAVGAMLGAEVLLTLALGCMLSRRVEWMAECR